MSTDTGFTYLALGDSYTIGESVPESDRFPVQTVKLLRDNGIAIKDCIIIARTGWTTDELSAGIQEAGVTGTFDVVTLLIGVNDQYRGRAVEFYKPAFTLLLERAIAFAGGHSDRVVVLSIPDWSAVPFAEGQDRQEISARIEEYNKANRKIAKKMKVHYLDITPSTLDAANDPSLVASDGLHYSGKEMAVWSKKLADILHNILQ
ncbi:SGNH/GDSL hydrolase family protein [Chitinophaga sp. CF118]|uniref:SGNH/GDSL hydrolase family protein n=1 Tax=Chitinophaga sp. CF118 TaxID=1884367 RepID=UPI0021017A8D|nr:SGNH/GDSL hydrolase family protein [Chitinophaga sp. CF118]